MHASFTWPFQNQWTTLTLLFLRRVCGSFEPDLKPG